MSDRLTGKRIAFLFTEGVEQVELTDPLAAVKDEGAETTLVSLSEGDVQMFNHLHEGDTISANRAVANVDASQFDALVLPGGVASPDALRIDEHAVRFVGDFVRAGKPVGVICHGPWTLVEADVVRDRTLTSWPSLQTDLRNAGATWVDEEVHVDGTIVSSRKPDDLPAFCRELIAAIERGAASTNGAAGTNGAAAPNGQGSRASGQQPLPGAGAMR
jgi:protease I